MTGIGTGSGVDTGTGTGRELVLVDSVTRLRPALGGAVVVGGSHAGVYAAYRAASAGADAVVLNDAGVGRDRAGVAGLAWLDATGRPGVAVDAATARIGDGRSTLDDGVVGHVNEHAARAGVRVGASAAEAVALLRRAPVEAGPVPAYAEARRVLDTDGGPVVVLDSVALVRPEDAGQVVVTGSHGALLGGDPAQAILVDAALAVFNDAGSPGGTGSTRLAALDARGIAGATVAHTSARIGDGLSTWEDGVLTAVNRTARTLGADVGSTTRDLVDRLRQAGLPLPTGGPR